MNRFLLLLALVATSAAAQTTTGVFVGNQGQPASLTYLDRAAGTVQQLSSVALSGFLQGTELMNGRLYVTGNGSRIDVVDPATRQRVAQITDATFPTARYFAQVGPSKAYVTTQNYADGATTAQVVILDLATNTVSGKIAVPVQPEGLTVAGGRVYVSTAAFGTTKNLVAIDPATDAVVATVDVGCSPRFVLADDDGEVFAVCTDTEEIVRLDAATGTVTGRTPAGADLGSASGLGQDATLARPTAGGEQEIFALTATGVLRYGTDTHAVTAQVAIPSAATRTLSAIGVDVQRAQVVIGRPDPTVPFSASGTVTVHGFDGALVASYAAGVFPSHISVVTSASTAAGSGPDARSLSLGAPAPNPATSSAQLRLTLAEASDVTVALVDVLGREAVPAVRSTYGAGEHRVSVDVRSLPAGVYVVRITSGGDAVTRRLTVTR